MKINKNIFICALLVLMLLACVNAVSADESLNETLGTDAVDDVVVADAPAEELSASGGTYVVDANGGGDYSSISDAVSAASGGETIFIKNGEYTETSKIDIGTKQLTFTGESQDGVIIKSGDNDLFYTTGSGGASLVIKGLTFKDISMTGARTPIFIGGNDNVEISDCTFDNCASRYGALRIFTSGSVTVDNCKFLGTKSSTGSYSSAIDFGGSGTADYTVKNSIIDASEISSASTASYIFGAIYNEKNTGTVFLDNVTISNCNLVSASGLIATKGNMEIKNSKIVNNYVYRDLAVAGLFFVNGAKTLTIETSIIQNNSQPNQILSANSGSASYNLNYNNIQGNTFNNAFVYSDGTYTLDANYWGSNDLPDGITANTWVVENNGEYTLNTGDALEKDVPGLTGEGGDEPVPGDYDLYISPDGQGSGLTMDDPTNFDEIFGLYSTFEIPEGANIFVCNGQYYLPEALIIPTSVNVVGESREGVEITVEPGIAVANRENIFDPDYTVDSVSLSRMTFVVGDAGSIFGSCTINEFNITDCIFASDKGVAVGVAPTGDYMWSTGTLNFNKNIVFSNGQGTITIYPNWNANINDNIFVYTNWDLIYSETEGEINVDYNFWGSNEPTTNFEYDNAIIFTAYSDASEIYNDESAKITIKATLLDGSTDAADHLPDYPIEALLSAAGDLSASEVTLENGVAEVTYSSDVARNDNVNINIFNLDLSVPITVKERYNGPIYVATTGSDDNEGSENAPVATVGKAVELALANGGSGQIFINEGTYIGNDYHVTGDLTVTGNGKVTLDANNEGRLFNMAYGDSANKIELSNLILTNANGYGAAVYSFANELILDNVTIVNNQATGYLVKSNGKLTIKDSNITRSMSGDVIQQTGSGDMLITNTVFEDNSIVDTSSVYGVIYISSGSGTLTIEDSKFINNNARQGVIKSNNNYDIVVKGTEFINNTNTVSYGGAIYAYGPTLTVSDSVFINNKAERDGGAIYVGWRTTATVDKSIFINNTAGTTSEGDAIYNGNKLSVNNSVLLTNAAHHLIYNDGEDNVVYAQNNWWGTNDDPKDLVASGYYEDDDWEEYPCGEVDVSNWVTMDASFAPADAQAGDEVTVTAVFSNANLPDGIDVTFTSTSGNLNTVVSTVDGQASTTYTIDANDDAIIATSTNAVIEMPIAEELTNIVTQDNFYTFFDESGILRDNVPFEELIFQGEFSDLAAGYVIIDRSITITGDEAVLNNMGFVVASEDVALDKLSFIATTPLGDLIAVTESDVALTNLTISYIVDEDGNSNAINVKGTDTIHDIYILDCDIYFESHVTKDNNLVTAVNFDDVEDVYMDGNNIVANMPSLTVSAYDFTYFMMGLCYVNPIRVFEAYGAELTNNNIDVIVNSYDSSYPTVQALYIVGSEDVLVKGNNFTMVDTLTPAGTAIYLYAVECGFSDGIEFIENNFDISTTGGQSGAGSAYALQVATSEATFIGNNITCDSNGPNLGIYSPYGFGQAKDLVIKDNFLNISGYAAGKNDFALISGIEIQTGYATIYNNTIYVQNKGDYGDEYPVSGISAVQYSANTLTFDIKDNEVHTNGKYAVDMLYPPQSAVVVNNTLYAYELTGDAAVYIKSGDNNEVHDNLPAEELTNIVTNDTFFRFFDEDGILLDTIEFDELIFQGDFSDLVDIIIVPDEMTLIGDDAALYDIALAILGDDVTVSGFTLFADHADFTDNGGAVVYVKGSDVTLDDVFVTYIAPDEVEAKGIFVNGADNFALVNSAIVFMGTNPGSNHYRGLEVRNGNEAIINNNTFSAVLPAVAVDFGASGIAQDLILAVGIQGGNDIEFTNNIVHVDVNGSVGSYPTVDAVMIHSANDILIKGNDIILVDTTTEDSSRYYYSLDIYSTTGTVESNNILVNTTAGVDRAGTAYPLQLTGPFTVTVRNNTLTAISQGPVVGIYTSNWGGPATLIAENNNIDVSGYATTGNYALIAGIEAEIDMLQAYNNTIAVANGAEYDDANQVIGVGIGTSYFYGDTSADIKDNYIAVDGKYAVYYAKAINTNVTGNTLYGHELEGDNAAVIEAGENNIIRDNLPVNIIATVLSGDDLEMSYNDGSAWTVTLTDANGNAIEGAAVKIGVAGKVYNSVTDENGVASLPINLISGTYDINATFDGDETYEASFAEAAVTVNKAVATLSGDNLNMSYKDGSAWAVTLTDPNGDAIAGVKVAFGISGKTYYIATDDAGVANLPINLKPGTYEVNASFSNSKYEAELITATITVNKIVPVLSAEDLTMNYKDGSAWAVTLTDANGDAIANTNVKFTISGTTYTVKTNSDGVASLAINLPVGTYDISAKFEGSSTLEAAEVNGTIVVNPVEYNIVAEDINMTYQDGTSYDVQLVDVDGNAVALAGKSVKITVNGKSYFRKTNDDGIASLPINLKAGTYEITAEYDGKEITNTIVINNA